MDIANSDIGVRFRGAVPCEQQSHEAVLDENSRLLRVISSLRDDISLLKEALIRANHRADYDVLTGLANRRLLVDRFTQASALAKRHRQYVTLLFLDLDNFKGINDRLGHAGGDQMLLQFAARLTASIRATDTAYRYGGDEFVVLLTEIDNQDNATIAVIKLLSKLAAPFQIDDTSIRMPVSVGIATYPDDGADLTELMEISDRSMFRHKALKTHRQRPTTVRQLQPELA